MFGIDNSSSSKEKNGDEHLDSAGPHILLEPSTERRIIRRWSDSKKVITYYDATNEPTPNIFCTLVVPGKIRNFSAQMGSQTNGGSSSETIQNWRVPVESGI